MAVPRLRRIDSATVTGVKHWSLTMWPHVATLSGVKKKPFRYPAKGTGKPDKLKESMTLELPEPLMINVRAAKDQLSGLLEQAARGNEIIITSDGQPKARLVPVKSARKPFQVDWELLRSVPPKPGEKSAEEIVREDRDGRP